MAPPAATRVATTRGGYRGNAPAGDGPVSFEEAEAQRAEADTWTHYSSHAR